MPVKKRKIAFLFPGQGRIPQGLPPTSDVGGRLFKLAAERGLPLQEWITSGSLDLLHRTEYAQPAVLIDSLAKEEALRGNGVKLGIVAGHSLGEYTALVSAGLLTPEEALLVVIERGRLMARVEGGMAAIVKLPVEEMRAICGRIGSGVAVANYNGPRQVVISGEQKALKEAVAAAEQAGGRAIPLRVSGPFHSPLMTETQAALVPQIESLSFNPPSVPVVSSVSGEVETDPVRLKTLLLTQITACVRWVDVVNSLVASGVTCAVEVGPGEILTGLGRRITSQVQFVTFKEALDG
ncbi:TPA: malonyl CoA-acyl carrier protein transacylase [Candidatus Acetothermia bacterium]|nr:malonyl CoA-acyl carrier protein transacylase [Candidatus Acetothermia bacterium]